MKWTILALCVFGCVPSLSGQTLTVEFAESAAESLTQDDRTLIISIAGSAHRDVLQLLPELGGPVTVTVSSGPDVIPETGEAGAALAPGHVLWVVDPLRSASIGETAGKRLRATLFHELHHLARGYLMTGSESPTTILDSVVSEGLATVFAREFAGDDAPWSSYPDDVVDWVRELLVLPPDASYRDWMFDHPDGRRWIGYRAGTFVADRATAASGLSSADLVSASTEDVLRLAGLR